MTTDMPPELAEHVETYYPLDYDEPVDLVTRVQTAAINLRDVASSVQDRHDAAVVLWQARRWLSDRGEWYGYKTRAESDALAASPAAPYCLCGAAAPYDHSLGCPHAVRPTPALVGCATCASVGITPERMAAFQSAMAAAAERTVLDLVDEVRGVCAECGEREATWIIDWPADGYDVCNICLVGALHDAAPGGHEWPVVFPGQYPRYLKVTPIERKEPNR